MSLEVTAFLILLPYHLTSLFFWVWSTLCSSWFMKQVSCSTWLNEMFPWKPKKFDFVGLVSLICLPIHRNLPSWRLWSVKDDYSIRNLWIALPKLHNISEYWYSLFMNVLKAVTNWCVQMVSRWIYLGVLWIKISYWMKRNSPKYIFQGIWPMIRK